MVEDSKLSRGSRSLCAVLFSVLVTACASVDFEEPKVASYANIDTRDTTLGASLAPLREDRHPKSGFYPLTSGIDALSMRLQLIARAEKTLDLQTYLIGDDAIGDLIFDRLLAAADRGVRVRVLLDDVGTGGIEKKLQAFSAHSNIELRLFNPFATRGLRVLDVWDGLRLNHRMHNKSLTADNEITIIGGRNIAAEYYSVNPAYNFRDLDVIAIGSVVPDTSVMFDRYWNDRHSVPYAQLEPEDVTEAEVAAFRANLRQYFAGLSGTPYAAVVKNRIEEFSYLSADEYYWAPYALTYDAPDKALGDSRDPEKRMTTSLAKVIGAAERELFVVSPYFVPRAAGIEFLSDVANRGVQVDVLTSGLAANDHMVIYGGYAPARKPLLRQGIRIYELRGDLILDGIEDSGADTKDSRSKLHTKAFMVDRRYIFIGSFNWDPRSTNLNTEMGVVIDSEALSKKFANALYKGIPKGTYSVTLNENGDLRWQTVTDGKVEGFEKEPETTWWTRFLANLTRLLPIRGQL